MTKLAGTETGRKPPYECEISIDFFEIQNIQKKITSSLHPCKLEGNIGEMKMLLTCQW